jgi:prophage antirepressor-like protein
MENKMDNFLGGGGIDYVIHDGDVFLRANELASLLGHTGVRMTIAAIKGNDTGTATAAHFVMILSEKLFDLRSELLKQEIEAALPDLSGFMDETPFD